EILGSAAIPMMLLAFGVGLGAKAPVGAEEKTFRGFWFVVLMKMVGFPIVVFCIAFFGFQLQGIELLAVVLISALPSAQNIYNFSSQYQIFVGQARRVVF